MKKYKIFVFVVTIFLFLTTSILINGEILIDLNYDKLPQGENNNGKIFIGEIKNIRKSVDNDAKQDEKYKNPNYLGSGLITYKEKSIDAVLKDILTNVLSYSGYDVATSNPDGSAPVLYAEIDKFDLWGYMGYVITVNFNVILLSSDQKTELFRKNINANIGFGVFDSLSPLFNRFQIVLDEVLFRSLILIESNQFVTAYNNLEKVEIQEALLKSKKLTTIPDDLPDDINYLDLTSNDITKISNLENKKDLLYIRLKGNKISKIENLDNNTELKGINLRDNDLTQIEGLENQKELRFLIAGNNEIAKISGLDNFNKLIWLGLNENDKLTSLKDIEGLVNLLILDISDCRKLSKVEFPSSFSKLYSLNMSASDISKIKGLDNLTGLRRLYILGNDISKIENLDSLVNLEVLEISDNDSIKKLENLDNLTNLRELKIVGTYELVFASGSIQKIENLENLTNLEYLNLGNNKIKMIENLGNLKKLKRLCLAGNKLRKIENLEELENLKYLVLKDGFGSGQTVPKKISQASYDLLKANDVVIDEKYNIDGYMKEYKIKIDEK